MSIKTKVEVSGLQKTSKFLGEMKELHKMPKGLKQAGQFLVDFFGGDVFDTQGGVYGQSWEPLNEQYRKSKARRFPGRGILERTGKLRSSFGFVTTSTLLRVFNPVSYAVKHQRGIGVPKRMMMKMDRARTSEVTRIVGKNVTIRIKEII